MFRCKYFANPLCYVKRIGDLSPDNWINVFNGTLKIGIYVINLNHINLFGS